MPIEKSVVTHRVCVVGGGVIGLCCAVILQQKGVATTLVAPGAGWSHASGGNAGHIATEQVEPLASGATLKSFPRRLFFRGGPVSLPWRDLPAWLPFSIRLVRASRPRRFRRGRAALRGLMENALPAWRRLTGAIGRPDLLLEEGHFVVWEQERTATAGRQAWMETDTGTAKARDATAAELEALAETVETSPAGAIRFTGTGQIADLAELQRELCRGFERLGGRIIDASVHYLDVQRPSVGLRLETGEHLYFDKVVIAAGHGSKPLLEALGHRAPIIAERGYHLQFGDATGWPRDLPPIVFEDRSLIVTRFRSGLRAAGFVEFGKAESPADPRKWERLQKHLDELGIKTSGAPARWMGARPTFPDYLPAIGRSSRAPDVYYAFGHQHLGLTLGPVTGEIVAALIAGEVSPVDLAAFDLDRF